jgi:hypothetical protein
MTGSVCGVKWFTTRLRNCHPGDKRFTDEEEVETDVQKWLRQQSRLLCCGFQSTGKAMGTSVSLLVEDMLRNKCFSRFQ